MRIADLDAVTLADAVARGHDLALWPLGATEQHGPHLPAGTDTIRVDALVAGIEARLPDLLVLPTLPLGASDEHGAFAGLHGVSTATLTQVLVDAAARLAWWKVRKVAFLSAHGGNLPALKAAVARLAEEVPYLRAQILGAAAGAAARAVGEGDGVDRMAQGAHAGERETSEIAHLRPRLVGTAPEGRSLDRVEIGPEGVVALAPEGVLGRPRMADGERGARYLAAQVDALVAELEALRSSG
jgi:creatinine amidohydrolase/Fe(II)-dependent formamide hydrolase-like protein